jgi:hypothetical protein
LQRFLCLPHLHRLEVRQDHAPPIHEFSPVPLSRFALPRAADCFTLPINEEGSLQAEENTPATLNAHTFILSLFPADP